MVTNPGTITTFGADTDNAVLQGFRFFAEICAPNLLNYGSQSFWNRLVLAVGHNDESIRHLIVAASRLAYHNHAHTHIHTHNHGLLVVRHQETSPPNDPVFLSHYCRGVKLLSQAKDPDPALVLMACLLLILCDEFQGSPFAALQHIVAGRKILKSYRCSRGILYRQSRNDVPRMLDEMGRIFSNLELSSGEINRQYHASLAACWLSSPTSKDLNASLELGPELSLSLSFGSIQEAADSLQMIARECTTLRLDDHHPPQTRFHTVPGLTDRLNDWLGRFTRLEVAEMERLSEGPGHGPLPTGPLPTDPRSTTSLPTGHLAPANASRLTTLHLLRAYHVCLHVMSRCCPFPQETTFDMYASNMEHLMAYAGLLAPDTTTRLIPILFLVATRHRSTSSRRQAVEMLARCGRLDGRILAQIALTAINIEEAAVDEPIVCSDIPEGNRVRLLGLGLDAEGESYVLRFRKYPYTATDRPARSEQGVTIPLQSGTQGGPQVADHDHAAQLLSDALTFEFMAFWNREKESAACI